MPAGFVLKTVVFKLKRHEVDMLGGPVLKNVILFSVPIILTGMLQLLYNAADMIVVGRFAESGALAAVGSTGSIVNLIVNVFMGISVGTCVVVAHALGAGDADRANRAAHTAVIVALVAGIFVGIFGFLCRGLFSRR